MITLERGKDGVTCPLIYCDVCGKQIKDCKNAMYIWHFGKEEEFKMIHKGACDDRSYKCSMELKYFFIYLMTNAGLDPRKLEDVIEKASLMGSM